MRCMSVVCQIINSTIKDFLLLTCTSCSENEFDGKRKFSIIYSSWMNERKKVSKEFFIFIIVAVESMPSNKLKKISFYDLTCEQTRVSNGLLILAWNECKMWPSNSDYKRDHLYFLPSLLKFLCLLANPLSTFIFLLFIISVSALWQYHSISLNVKLWITSNIISLN